MTIKNRRGRVVSIPLKTMFVDRRYQRTIVQATVDKIAADWDWLVYTPILLSNRGNGKYAIVDGQHRYYAALKAGLVSLPCVVVVDATPPEEGMLFDKRNRNVTRIRPLQEFRARLFGRDPECVGINDVLRAHGLGVVNLNDNHHNITPTLVACVDKITAIWRQENGNEILNRICGFIVETWDKTEDKRVRGDVFMALNFVFTHKKWKDIDVERLSSRVAARPLAKRLQESVGVKSLIPGSCARALGYVFIAAYNLRLSSERRMWTPLAAEE